MSLTFSRESLDTTMSDHGPQQVPTKRVDSATTRSLLIATYFDDTPLGMATGFVVSGPIGPLLVTARHVFTGRHHHTGKPLTKNCAIPNRVIVWLIYGQELGVWRECEERILSGDSEPLWIEHPTLGARADIAALPLSVPEGTRVKPYDIQVPNDPLLIGPAGIVSVVGFPFGLSAGGRFAIWASGFVATDMDLDYEELPAFLIDCRSRSGQSGSPVVARRDGHFSTTTGLNYMSGQQTDLLGVYSGRVNAESDLGFVWKLSAVRDLVAAA
jgi:hypothetical protein